jgi:(1->4)-alpha-D-glucan 1-alpha-D-glucosylmutase
MAKGIEDTTFFRFTPFLAQNEVGNSPGNKPQSAEELHRWFAERQEQWPLALSATTTHDTKRSEDARWRIAALGSMPREWRRELRAWGRMNARARRGAQPNHGTEHYLYQTLVAAWDGEGGPEFADRICEHMRKASREAKVWTTWTAPDEEGEAALEAFVRAILDRREGARFRARLERFVATVRPRAERISLSMVALKCLAPGVPDFYQGAESWLLTLTDPDNRRPPDFAELAESGGGGRQNTKLLLTRHLLQLRATKPALFEGGEYVPLEVGDEGGGFAFLRTRGRDRVLVALSPRFDAEAIDVRELARAAGGDRWWDWLTGGKVTDEAGPSEEPRPVAVLTNFRPGAPCD